MRITPLPSGFCLCAILFSKGIGFGWYALENIAPVEACCWKILRWSGENLRLGGGYPEWIGSHLGSIEEFHLFGSWCRILLSLRMWRKYPSSPPSSYTAIVPLGRESGEGRRRPAGKVGHLLRADREPGLRERGRDHEGRPAGDHGETSIGLGQGRAATRVMTSCDRCPLGVVPTLARASPVELTLTLTLALAR